MRQWLARSNCRLPKCWSVVVVDVRVSSLQHQQGQQGQQQLQQSDGLTWLVTPRPHHTNI